MDIPVEIPMKPQTRKGFFCRIHDPVVFFPKNARNGRSAISQFLLQKVIERDSVIQIIHDDAGVPHMFVHNNGMNTWNTLANVIYLLCAVCTCQCKRTGLAQGSVNAKFPECCLHAKFTPGIVLLERHDFDQHFVFQIKRAVDLLDWEILVAEMLFVFICQDDRKRLAIHTLALWFPLVRSKEEVEKTGYFGNVAFDASSIRGVVGIIPFPLLQFLGDSHLIAAHVSLYSIIIIIFFVAKMISERPGYDELASQIEAFHEKEGDSRVDMGGTPLHDHLIEGYEYDYIREFIDCFNVDKDGFFTSIGDLGDEAGNHNQLLYFCKHIMPYLMKDSPGNLKDYFRAIDYACQAGHEQTEMWNEWDEDVKITADTEEVIAYVNRLEEAKDECADAPWEDVEACVIKVLSYYLL